MTNENDLTRQLFDDAQLHKPDPMDLFVNWLNEAKASEINDANAMSLATVDSNGMPDCRIMLLNGFGPDGFVFYTNLRSAKGQELAQNPKVCLLFHWKSLRRQVRVRGEAAPVSKEEADAYFATRPRGSQIGAYASHQSTPLLERGKLTDEVAQLTKQFEGKDVPRPDHWSGFRVAPSTIEFWQDGQYRLHDRVTFSRAKKTAPWTAQRLNP
ncbi:Pyridoxamine 5'-phosphate oxidase [hydrothermal vent metagenome]|uniref:Pyridoxamine 5'-phosphate oxidase n=1 Tax=hydrothermal vent metagenome TaxID=652676 RepID=A0A3B0TX13_9ZZZZ